MRYLGTQGMHPKNAGRLVAACFNTSVGAKACVCNFALGRLIVLIAPLSVPGGGGPGAPSWFLRLKVRPSNLGSSDWIGQGSTLAHPRFHLRINPASIQHRRPRSSIINAHSQASISRVASSILARFCTVARSLRLLEPIKRAFAPYFSFLSRPRRCATDRPFDPRRPPWLSSERRLPPEVARVVSNIYAMFVL